MKPLSLDKKKNSFSQMKAYIGPLPAGEKVASVLLATPPPDLTPTLPDLKNELFCTGRNDRPDLTKEGVQFFLQFRALSTNCSVKEGDALYLKRDKETGHWTACEEGETTPIWLTLKSSGTNTVEVSTQMQLGANLDDPLLKSTFSLNEQQTNTTPPPEIGKFRMESSLLARQRTRWVGLDHFINNHGGPEFAFALNKQRIEFGDMEHRYACYVAEGESLIWQNGRWSEAPPGVDTKDHFLLFVRKVEERMMHLTLWDPTGKTKITLTLIKPSEPPLSTNRIIEDFRYVGTRNWNQWVFDIKGNRQLVKVKDWWLQTDNNWQKLQTPQQVDEYVMRTRQGFLLIINGSIKKNGQSFLAATLYNPTRSLVENVEIPLNSPLPTTKHSSKSSPHQIPIQGMPANESICDEAPARVEEDTSQMRREEEDFYQKDKKTGQEVLKKPSHHRGYDRE